MSVDMNFHQVKKVVVQNSTRNDTHRCYDVRTLVIHHGDKTSEITLFSDDIKDADETPLAFTI